MKERKGVVGFNPQVRLVRELTGFVDETEEKKRRGKQNEGGITDSRWK